MSISKKLKASNAKSSAAKTIPHLIIEARAGSGKSTTLIEGLKKLKGVKSDHPAAKNPSPQQSDVYKSLLLSKATAQSVAFVAFNTSIKDELARRVPPGCEAMTSHGLGRRAIANTFGNECCRINNDRTQDIISELLGADIWRLRKEKPVFLKAVQELVDLCKQNLVGRELCEDDYNLWADKLDALCSHYDVELDKFRDEVYYWVPRVLERSKEIQKDRCISFTDMIWLPIALDLPLYQYDLLLVDEAQDLNRCQQALVRKAGKRLVLCGDPKQAIYGFAGADAKSMDRMFEELSETPQGCKMLPLNYTRRCGRAIVAEANKIVPDFYACEDNPEGKISTALYKGEDTADLDGKGMKETSYRSLVNDGDMVLCRVNAPLVSQCFKFLKAGRLANIQGRDIGQGLIKTIKSIEKKSLGDPFTVPVLVSALSAWLRDETEKELKKRHPSDARILALEDRHDCLQCFCEDAKNVAEVISKIETIFSDTQRDGIRLSSGHRAKGLESARVFILMPEGAQCPHPMAKLAWEKEQEANLLYVMITRAIDELIYVR